MADRSLTYHKSLKLENMDARRSEASVNEAVVSCIHRNYVVTHTDRHTTITLRLRARVHNNQAWEIDVIIPEHFI